VEDGWGRSYLLTSGGLDHHGWLASNKVQRNPRKPEHARDLQAPPLLSIPMTSQLCTHKYNNSVGAHVGPEASEHNNAPIYSIPPKLSECPLRFPFFPSQNTQRRLVQIWGKNSIVYRVSGGWALVFQPGQCASCNQNEISRNKQNMKIIPYTTLHYTTLHNEGMTTQPTESQIIR